MVFSPSTTPGMILALLSAALQSSRAGECSFPLQPGNRAFLPFFHKAPCRSSRVSALPFGQPPWSGPASLLGRAPLPRQLAWLLLLAPSRRQQCCGEG